VCNCAINTFAVGLIQAVRAKIGFSHMALHGHNSGTESVRELFKRSKDLAILPVCNEKKFFGFGFWIFCE